jgi:hypothetical protein
MLIRPPRTIESVLHALGADADYRDDLLGDLAEELDIRARRDGERRARRWYYRESVRAIPHLLRSWWKHLRVLDVVDMVGVVVTSYVILVMVVLFVIAMLRAMLTAFGVVIDPPASLFDNPLLFVVAAGFGAAGSVFGGWVAASLYRRAPLVGAMALGLAWTAVGLIALIITTTGPFWYRFLAPIVVVWVGTTCGGVLRARTSSGVAPIA